MSNDSSSTIVETPPSQTGAPSIAPSPRSTDARVAEINSLLSALEDAAAETGMNLNAPSKRSAAVAAPEQHDNRLVQVRLGIASALFTALERRHPPTASHCLRVALGCSSWALHKKLDEKMRDAVELAALVHDIGLLGCPDAVLLKITEPDCNLQERERAANVALDVLKQCCSSKRVLEAVRYVGADFDGTGSTDDMAGEKLPLESRMIAIVNAFDELTTLGRGGATLSRAGAIESLSQRAGRQFDPILLNQFIDLLSQQQDGLTLQVASRWLGELAHDSTELPWQLQPPQAKESVDPATPIDVDGASGHPLFERKLLDAMHDGVVFVDAQSRIFMWSKGAELLTGVSEVAAVGRRFAPSLLDMCNGAGRRVNDDSCPVTRALETSSQLRQRLQILGRQGRHVAVDLHTIPVQGVNGDVQGATVLLHDAQPEASLEQRCEALHAEVTKDPMTKVANRAEFDRMLALFMEAHEQAQQPCSLIMIDIDQFKNINDTHGHQAGDEAIITVANLLKSMCRSGDLVARYGGEEFALLCADCSREEAAGRAEQIRKQLSETPHRNLGNKRLTASFGVAELQPDDSPETMLGRADRALLMAKDQGRNQVVQLSGKMNSKVNKKSWWSFGALRAKPLLETSLSTEVPVSVAVEKLKGFVSDLSATVISTHDDRAEVEISSENIGANRRRGDRPVFFRVEIEFSERRDTRSNSLGFASGEYVQTDAKVTIRPKRNRDRRAAERSERARLIVQSLKAYLMAKEVQQVEQAEMFQPAGA